MTATPTESWRSNSCPHTLATTRIFCIGSAAGRMRRHEGSPHVIPIHHYGEIRDVVISENDFIDELGLTDDEVAALDDDEDRDE